MNRVSWKKQVARQFDGEHQSAPPDDDRAAAYRNDLQRLRAGAEATREQAEIGDSQFPAFYAGIRDSVGAEAGRSRDHRRWAMVSLAGAALVAAGSLWVLFGGDPAPAGATVVEEAHSELDGAEVHWYASDDGNATVWVELAEEDMW
jgi:hypothetical protein